MSDQSPSSFDDPVLKAALKRAVGSEAAPSALRARVEQALHAEAMAPLKRAAAHRPAGWRNNPLVGLAAAAMLIIGVGLIYTNVMRTDDGRMKELPAQMAMDMAAAHDRALANAALHELKAPKDDLAAVRGELKEKLEHPVLVASLGNDWDFQGARIASVGTTPASELLFKNKTNGDTVSVFSIPGRAYYATEEGLEYEQVADGHPIAGFVRKGIVHCIVGSKGSKLDEDDLAKIRNQVQKQLIDDQSNAAGAEDGCGNHSELARR
jgi:hypothetical protein